MARSSFLLLLSSLFQQSLASPVHLQQRDSIFSFSSTLVIPLATGRLPVVTSYPSQGTTIPPSSSSVLPPFPSTRSGVAVFPSSSPSVPFGTAAIPSGSIPLGPDVSSSTILPTIDVTSPSFSIGTGVNPSSVIPPNAISSSTILSPIGVTSLFVSLGTGISESSVIPPNAKSSSTILPPIDVTSPSVHLGTDVSPSPRPTVISSTILLPIGVTSPFVPLGTVVIPSSITPPTVASSNSIPSGNGVTSFKPLPPSSTSSTGPSGGSASLSAPGDSSPPRSGSSAPVIGTYSATPTVPTEAFPSYDAPTGIITGAAVRSEAAQLTGLFFAIYANRNRITDVNLKQKYIDDVRRTKEETDSLFNALDVKLDPVPECSNTKRKRYAVSERRLRLLIAKRDFISGITGLLGDAAKLLSCATEVVNNLVTAVEAPVPIISDIESLTNALNEIAQDLEKEDQNPSNSPSESQPSSIEESTASSSASSCTASSAIPRCTESVTLSTSFLSGTTGSSTVQRITTQVCTTITACGESASTAFTTISTATSTTGVVCATDCAACANPVVKRDNVPYQQEPLEKRSLDDPSDFDSVDQYVLEQIETFPGRLELDHKQTGRLSSALTRPFEKTPMRLYVAGLFGCTSVVIISETGVWFSHHWESPSFLGDDSRFEREVLSTIRDGDPDDLARMPGAFSLAEGSGILSANSNVQIFISTPKNPDDGKELFEARVDKIVDLLTGEGKPWAGITPIRRGYVKSKSERERDQFALRANSKVLIEYDNNQNAAFGKEPKPNQQAIYRVWLEQQKFEHQWDAKVGIQKDAACSNPNQKRQNGGSCRQPSAYGPSTAVRTPFSTPAPQPPSTSSIPPPPSSTLSTIPLPTPSPIITVPLTGPLTTTLPPPPPPPPKTSITTPPPPDFSSKACIDCTDSLGASECGPKDSLCLVQQCKSDKDCQACGIDCSTFASV